MQGKQIMLRDFVMDDLDAIHYWLQPGHRWQELDGPYYPNPTAAEIEATLNRIRKSIQHNGWPSPRQRQAIADKTTGKIIGQVSRYWISEETHWPAIGIGIFDPAHWRQGKGYEALGLWSEYLFRNEPKFVRLDLRTWSGNTGMMKLALKVGYKEEARFRMARIVNGEYYDGLGYGILRSEWETLYPDGFAATIN
jgi:RimJ/RimL family protein N-acetyltransferase